MIERDHEAAACLPISSARRPDRVIAHHVGMFRPIIGRRIDHNSEGAVLEHRLTHDISSVAGCERDLAAHVFTFVIFRAGPLPDLDQLARPLAPFGYRGHAHRHVGIAAEANRLKVLLAAHGFHPQLAAAHIPAHGRDIRAVHWSSRRRSTARPCSRRRWPSAWRAQRRSRRWPSWASPGCGCTRRWRGCSPARARRSTRWRWRRSTSFLTRCCAEQIAERRRMASNFFMRERIQRGRAVVDYRLNRLRIPLTSGTCITLALAK